VGGFETWGCWVLELIMAGGVGIGLLDVAEFLASEAEESWRGRPRGRALVADEGIPPSVLGEAVLFRGYCGRLMRCGCLRVPPGDGRGAMWPWLRTAIDCGAWGSCMRVSWMPPGEGWTMGIGGKYSVWVWVPSSWW
jgi:hypothetical protein